ncbi:MAG: carboxypeptidase regulatory-like domain-containing protein [Candidatus Thermoplasmatota archaeon]|nr:carboxypeptidase regulatory-like domain-containing protein [Candidatus Thermoplasmatota archaeon]
MLMRDKGVLFGLICVLLLGISAVSFIPTAAEGAETGYFHVYVEASDIQGPIAGAYVAIDDDITWITEKDGICTPTGIEFGVHNITVFAKGYKASMQKVEFIRNGTTYNFVLDPKEEVREGIIKGKVYLEAYLPPYDAGEAIVGIDSLGAAPVSDMVDVYPTDDPLIGEYYVIVQPGDYDPWCFAYGHVPQHLPSVTVGPGQVAYVDFHLKFTGMKESGLAGNVTDSVTGDPISGATVIATNGVSTFVTSTDSYGFYFFISPPAGSYTLIAASSSYDPGTASGTVNWGQITYVDIQLKKADGKRTILWGFVYGNGIPLSTGNVFTDVPHVVNTHAMGISGLYVIMDFPGDENHLVGATAPGYFPVSMNITVPTGAVQRQDFYLQGGDKRTAVLIASVYEEGTGLDVNGSTVLLDNPGTFSDSQYSGSASNTVVWVGIPAWGSYSMNCLVAGYTFVSYDIPPGTGPYLPSDTFALTFGTVNHAELFMKKTETGEKAKIWGYVTDATYSSNIAGCPILDITGNMTLFSTTDAVGFYIEYVSPDTYTLVALPPGAYLIMNYDHATGIWGWGPWTGTVAPGESRHVDYVVKTEKEGSMLISGQVVMEGTGDPVSAFDLEATSPSTTVLYDSTPSTGFFLFSPLWETGVWTVYGNHSSLYVVNVEYWLLTTGTHHSSTTLPISFNLTYTDCMWVKITVQKEVPNNRTQIWGYVYVDSIGGYTSHFSSVLDLSGAMTVFDVTDSTGHYQRFVSPGTFTLMPLAVGGYSVLSYDYATGTLSTAPWNGIVSAGESRHVDFVMKQDRESAKIAGQVVMAATNAPVSGFHVGISSGSLSYTETTPSNGFFVFPPIYLFSTWELNGFHPSLYVVEVKYHLWPSGSVSTSPVLPVNFAIAMTDIMWVEIIVSQQEPQVSKLYGNVYKLFTYAPAAGSMVRIYQNPGLILVDTLTADPGGYYEKYLSPGDYYVKASLSGYAASSANVVMTTGSIIYQPFYLFPRIIPIPLPLNISIRFVNEKNDTPVAGLKVSIAGVADLVTDGEGMVRFGIPEAGEYSIRIGAASGVLYDANGNKVGEFVSPLKLESNETYTAKVTLYREIIIETGGDTRDAKENVIPDIGWLGILLLVLIIGFIVGFVVRKPKNTSDIEE